MNVYEKALRDLFGKSEELKDIKYTGEAAVCDYRDSRELYGHLCQYYQPY